VTAVRQITVETKDGKKAWTEDQVLKVRLLALPTHGNAEHWGSSGGRFPGARDSLAWEGNGGDGTKGKREPGGCWGEACIAGPKGLCVQGGTNPWHQRPKGPPKPIEQNLAHRRLRTRRTSRTTPCSTFWMRHAARPPHAPTWHHQLVCNGASGGHEWQSTRFSTALTMCASWDAGDPSGEHASAFQQRPDLRVSIFCQKSPSPRRQDSWRWC